MYLTIWYNCCQIQALSFKGKVIEPAIADVSTEILEEVWKNKRWNINYVIRLIGGNIDQQDIWIKLPEYFYYKEYWNPQKKMNTLLRRFFKPLKTFLRTL